MYNILICDDEPDILTALKIYLTDPSYNIFTAENGDEAIKIALEQELHLVLMDIMMPKVDGISAMSKIREHSNVPVILISAKSEDTDKILGLSIGADDYITKPFNPVEVAMRVKSQIRRYTLLGSKLTKENTGLTIGNITINDEEKSVSLDERPISLTPTEYDILLLLMKSPGKVFSPSEIYRLVWKESPCGGENTVAVHIRHLREKLEINPNEPRYIKVVWGQGYKIDKGARD